MNSKGISFLLNKVCDLPEIITILSKRCSVLPIIVLNRTNELVSYLFLPLRVSNLLFPLFSFFHVLLHKPSRTAHSVVFLFYLVPVRNLVQPIVNQNAFSSRFQMRLRNTVYRFYQLFLSIKNNSAIVPVTNRYGSRVLESAQRKKLAKFQLFRQAEFWNISLCPVLSIN